MDTGSIIAIVAIIVAAVVAIGVAAWQIKASRDKPKPHFAVSGEPIDEGAWLPAELSNAGGAAPRCHALAHVGNNFYEFRAPVVAQLPREEVRMRRLGLDSAPSEAEVPFVVWTVAQDGRGRWWDARRGRRIRKPVNTWLRERSNAAKLPIPVEIV